MAREQTSTSSPVAPGVAFEVQRFEWTSEDRLELVGRWFGLRGHRFLRPTLDVQVDGDRRRMLADLEHKPWAPEEGQDWIAAFTWRGEPGNFDDGELTVSPDLAVQLPAPGGSLERADVKASDAGNRLPVRRPRSAVLEAELAAALAEVQRLGDELERAQSRHSEAARELRDKVRGEHSKGREVEQELERARAEAGERLAAAEAAATEESRALREERDAAATERDEAAAARDAAVAAAAEARAEGEAVLRKLEAAEAEREALTEARDRARQERNAWMSRARAAAAGKRSEAASWAAAAEQPEPAESQPAQSRPAESEPATEPLAEPAAPASPAERRTIQIGDRPGPVRPAPASPARRGGAQTFIEEWGPRLAAVATLLVIVVILVLLLT
jgi:hypothetical protein